MRNSGSFVEDRDLHTRTREEVGRANAKAPASDYHGSGPAQRHAENQSPPGGSWFWRAALDFTS